MIDISRSSIGFDRLFEFLNSLETQPPRFDAYPPYNVFKTDDNKYRVELAVAGFTPDDLTVEQTERQLVVSGKKQTSEQTTHTALYQGLASRDFVRRFTLAETMEIEHVTLNNGVLTIDLINVIPERLRPKKFEIATQPSSSSELLE